jgi:hypothetical protein
MMLERDHDPIATLTNLSAAQHCSASYRRWPGRFARIGDIVDHNNNFRQ